MTGESAGGNNRSTEGILCIDRERNCIPIDPGHQLAAHPLLQLATRVCLASVVQRRHEDDQQTVQVLAQVISGNPLLVTERSMTRWRLEAVEGNPDPAERMRAGRSHRRGQDPAASWPSGKARYTPAKIDPLLSDSRGEC